MSDVDRLLAWFAEGALVRPDAAQPSTVHLARALATLAGVSGIPASPPAAQIAAAIGEVKHCVFILIDGLGMNLIEALPAVAFLRRHFVLELQAVFPSSTAPALTSLATGCWPAEHAVTGWWTYLPDAGLTSTILPFVERFGGRPLEELGVSANAVFRTPSLLPRMRDAASWMPAPIAGSIYSRYFTGNTPTRGYRRIGDACAAIAERIAATAGATYTYFYIPDLDNAEHEHGPDAPEIGRVLQRLAAEIERLAEALPGSARIVISADHGQIAIPPPARHALTAKDPLLRSLRHPPTGDYRVPLFHAADGAGDDFAAEFRARFGETWALLRVGDADELRLLGPEPIGDETRRRLGDYLVIGAGAEAILYVPDAPMRGYHGGLSAAEMRIPLIVI